MRNNKEITAIEQVKNVSIALKNLYVSALNGLRDFGERLNIITPKVRKVAMLGVVTLAFTTVGYTMLRVPTALAEGSITEAVLVVKSPEATSIDERLQSVFPLTGTISQVGINEYEFFYTTEISAAFTLTETDIIVTVDGVLLDGATFSSTNDEKGTVSYSYQFGGTILDGSVVTITHPAKLNLGSHTVPEFWKAGVNLGTPPIVSGEIPSGYTYFNYTAISKKQVYLPIITVTN